MSAVNEMRGVDELRSRRGPQRPTFNEVADHIVDFVERHPETERELDDFALFLATVEDITHDHENADASSLSERR